MTEQVDILANLKEVIAGVNYIGQKFHVDRAKDIVNNRLRHFVVITEESNRLIKDSDTLDLLDELVDEVLENPHSRFWNKTRHLKSAALLRNLVTGLSSSNVHKRKLLFLCEHCMLKE